MTTGIDIKEKNAAAVAAELSKMLADEFVLYTKTRNAHWNVEGVAFYTMHKFLKTSMSCWMKRWTMLQNVFFQSIILHRPH